MDAIDTASVAQHKQRVRMLNAVYACYERRDAIAYSQTRPSQLLRHGLPVRVAARAITKADCSGLVAIGCDWSRINPKVDWRYTNTWTQLALFTHEIPLDRAEPGDLVFYGPKRGDPHHVAIYKGNGHVYTNGHHPMSIEQVDYRRDRIHIRSIL